MESTQKRTMQIPFTNEEWESFNNFLFQNGYKKQTYVRKLIIDVLRKETEKKSTGEQK